MATNVNKIDWDKERAEGRLPYGINTYSTKEIPPYQKPSEEILEALRKIFYGMIAGNATIIQQMGLFVNDTFPEYYGITKEQQKELIKWWQTFDRTWLKQLRKDIYSKAIYTI